MLAARFEILTQLWMLMNVVVNVVGAGELVKTVVTVVSGGASVTVVVGDGVTVKVVVGSGITGVNGVGVY